MFFENFPKLGTDLESEGNLNKLSPSRRYIYEEVARFRFLLSGVVMNGRIVLEMSNIEEKERWYQFDVTYNDETVDTIYLFKF